MPLSFAVPDSTTLSTITAMRASNPAPDLNWHTALLAANQAQKQLATDVAANPQDPVAIQNDWNAYVNALLDLHGRGRKAATAFEV